MKTMALALAAMAISGCTMMIGGRDEAVTVNSDPPGQEIRIDDQAYTTPVTVMLDRRSDHLVVMPDGQEVAVEHKLDAWIIPSILLFFPIGGTVDFVSGYAFGNLSPDDLDFRDGQVFVRGKPRKRPD